MTVMVLASAFVIFFSLAFASKRRFGTLGFALAAGTLLATQTGKDLAALLLSLNIPTGSLSVSSVAVIILTMLPAVILLFGGPTYTTKRSTIIGSLLFATMALLLLMSPLGSVLELDKTGHDILVVIARYAHIILAGFIVCATVDMWSIHTFSRTEKTKK